VKLPRIVAQEAAARLDPSSTGGLTWFDDTNALRPSAATPEYARVRDDEPRFIASIPAPFIITKEHVIVA